MNNFNNTNSAIAEDNIGSNASLDRRLLSSQSTSRNVNNTSIEGAFSLQNLSQEEMSWKEKFDRIKRNGFMNFEFKWTLLNVVFPVMVTCLNLLLFPIFLSFSGEIFLVWFLKFWTIIYTHLRSFKSFNNNFLRFTLQVLEDVKFNIYKLQYYYFVDGYQKSVAPHSIIFDQNIEKSN